MRIVRPKSKRKKVTVHVSKNADKIADALEEIVNRCIERAKEKDIIANAFECLNRRIEVYTNALKRMNEQLRRV